MAFSCSDAVSGIDQCPAPKYLVSEGTDLSVSGSATDNAGNTATTTLSGLKVDQTRPTLTGAPQGTPNAAGWYRERRDGQVDRRRRTLGHRRGDSSGRHGRDR